MFAGDYNEPTFQRSGKSESFTGSSHPLRDDFKVFLKNELAGIAVEFSLQTVTMNTISSSSSFNDHTLARPVLCVELTEEQKVDSKQSKSSPFQHFPTKSISVLNHLDISSLTTLSSSSEEVDDNDEDDDLSSAKQPKSRVSIDTLTADWLVGVFLCRSPTDSSMYDF